MFTVLLANGEEKKGPPKQKTSIRDSLLRDNGRNIQKLERMTTTLLADTGLLVGEHWRHHLRTCDHANKASRRAEGEVPVPSQDWDSLSESVYFATA